MGQHAPLSAAAGDEVVYRALDRSQREVHELRALVGTISLLVEQSGDEPGSRARLRSQVRAAIDEHRRQMFDRLIAQRARIGGFARPQPERAAG